MRMIIASPESVTRARFSMVAAQGCKLERVVLFSLLAGPRAFVHVILALAPAPCSAKLESQLAKSS